ncbi:MAG TPA: hypothetical protein VIY49_02240 [Bryobacteraceae bacterium]
MRAFDIIFAGVLMAGSNLIAASASPIADAAMRGDKAALGNLLRQKADVNAPQPDGAPISREARMTWPPPTLPRPMRLSGERRTPMEADSRRWCSPRAKTASSGRQFWSKQART